MPMFIKGKKNKKILGLFLIILTVFIILIFKFQKINLFDDATRYKPAKHLIINPKTYSLAVNNKNYVYVSSDKKYQFSFPKNWKVEKCIEGDCESSNAYKIYPGSINHPGGIGIDVIKPGSWCDNEPERLSKAGLWQEVSKTDVPQKHARGTLIEGIEQGDYGTSDLYLRSMKYIQTKESCYIIMAGTKNDPKLYRQLQIIRDSFQILK